MELLRQSTDPRGNISVTGAPLRQKTGKEERRTDGNQQRHDGGACGKEFGWFHECSPDNVMAVTAYEASSL